MQLLEREIADLKQRNNDIHGFLMANREKMFSSISVSSDVTLYLIQYCIYPRLSFSPGDAIFSVKFIKKLQELNIDTINILQLLGKLLLGILPTFQCCTEKESHCIGIFFLELFKLLRHWADNWASECEGKSSFSDELGSKKSIDQQRFLDILEQINKRVAHNMLSCLKSKQYNQMKAALSVLNKIKDVFPDFRGDKRIPGAIEKQLAELLESNKDIESDLKTFAN